MSVLIKQRATINVPNGFHHYNGCTGVVTGFIPKKICTQVSFFWSDTYETQQYAVVKLDMNGPTIHVSPICLSLIDSNIRPIR